MNDEQIELYKLLLDEKVHTFSRHLVAIDARIDDFDNPTVCVYFLLKEDRLVLDLIDEDIEVDDDEIDYVTKIVNEWYRLGGKQRMQELKCY